MAPSGRTAFSQFAGNPLDAERLTLKTQSSAVDFTCKRHVCSRARRCCRWQVFARSRCSAARRCAHFLQCTVLRLRTVSLAWILNDGRFAYNNIPPPRGVSVLPSRQTGPRSFHKHAAQQAPIHRLNYIWSFQHVPAAKSLFYSNTIQPKINFNNCVSNSSISLSLLTTDRK